jgi:hypothetical protein
MYKLGIDGGGFTRWDSASPSMDELKQKFSQGVNGDIDTLRYNDNSRTVTFKESSFSLTGKNGDNSLMNGFIISGGKHIKFLDTEDLVNSLIETQGNFLESFDEPYFKMLWLGRGLIDDESWSGNPGDIETTVDTLKLKSDSECLANIVGPVIGGEIPISSFLDFSLRCGFKDVDGINKIRGFKIKSGEDDPGEILDGVQRQKWVTRYHTEVNQYMKEVLDKIIIELSAKYREKYSFETTLTSQEDGTSINLKIFVQVKLEDDRYQVIGDKEFVPLILSYRKEVNIVFPLPVKE